MLERIVENWLTDASEKSYQVPFSYMLQNEGYTVKHISRHCAMELGKDILAIDPDGTPCAFQLKGGDISLSQWTKELFNQVRNLVELPIVHPSIPFQSYKSYLVTNGKIEEEVSRAIDDYNRKNELNQQPQLHVITGGDLKSKAKNLENNLWPTELIDIKLLLELYLVDGRNVFPKERFATLLESTMSLNPETGKNHSKAACERLISSCALLTSLVTSNFEKHENYVAIVEAWTIYVSYVLVSTRAKLV